MLRTTKGKTIKINCEYVAFMIYRLLQNEENITKELGCKPENGNYNDKVTYFLNKWML